MAEPVEFDFEYIRSHFEFGNKPIEEWTLLEIMELAWKEGQLALLNSEEGVCTFEFHRSLMETNEERHGLKTCGCGHTDEEHESVQVCPKTTPETTS
jgi:hypothetical protein